MGRNLLQEIEEEEAQKGFGGRNLLRELQGPETIPQPVTAPVQKPPQLQPEMVQPEREGLWQGFIKPTLEEIGRVGVVAPAETALALASPILTWPAGKLSGIAHLYKGEPEARAAEDEVMAKGYQPYTREGQEAVQKVAWLIQKGLWPAKKAGEELKKMGYPKLSYLLETGGEVALFQFAGGIKAKVKARGQPKLKPLEKPLEGLKEEPKLAKPKERPLAELLKTEERLVKTRPKEVKPPPKVEPPKPIKLSELSDYDLKAEINNRTGKPKQEAQAELLSRMKTEGIPVTPKPKKGPVELKKPPFELKGEEPPPKLVGPLGKKAVIPTGKIPVATKGEQVSLIKRKGEQVSLEAKIEEVGKAKLKEPHRDYLHQILEEVEQGEVTLIPGREPGTKIRQSSYPPFMRKRGWTGKEVARAIKLEIEGKKLGTRQQEIIDSTLEDAKARYERDAAEIERLDKVGEAGLKYKHGIKPEAQTSIFDFKPAGRIEGGQVPRPGQTTRVSTTGYIKAAGRSIISSEDAAALLSKNRKSAQELAYTIAVDKNGTILEIHKYSKGTRAYATVSPPEIAGRALNVKGTKKLYFVHNHPSGDLTPSRADIDISNEIGALTRMGDIELKALVIGRTKWTEIKPGPSGFEKYAEMKKIPAELKTMALPVKERFLKVSPELEKRARISNYTEAKEAFKKYGNEQDGFLFVNTKNQPIGFLPFEKGKTYREMTRDVLAFAEKTNAGGIVINNQQMLPNRTKYIDAIGKAIIDIPILDVIEAGKSKVETGAMPTRGIAYGVVSRTDVTLDSLGFQQMYERFAERMKAKKAKERGPKIDVKVFDTGNIVKHRKFQVEVSEWTDTLFGKRLEKKKIKAEAPPIYEAELKVLKEIPDLPKAILDYKMQNPPRVFDLHLGSDAKEMFYRPILEARDRVARGNELFQNKVKELRGKVPFKSKKRLQIYAISQQYGGKARLGAQGIKEIPKLTAKELEIYKEGEAIYKTLYIRLNEARRLSGKAPFPSVKHYAPFIHDLGLIDQMGFNPIFDKSAVINELFLKLKTTPFGYAKPRIEFVAKKLNLDYFDVMTRYGYSSINHIQMSPVIAKLREYMLTIGKGKDAWKMEKAIPRTAEWLNAYINFQAGQRAFKLPPVIERGLRRLNKHALYAILAYNIRSAAIQPSALLQAYVVLGEKYTAYGIESLLHPSKRNFAMEKSKHLKSRDFDIAYKDAFDLIRGGKITEGQKAAGKLGLKLLKILDMETAKATWQGAYQKATKELNYTEAKAIQYADDITIKTQASGAPQDVAPIQRSALGRTVTLFQTFVINEWNFMVNDVLGYKNVEISKPQAFKNIVRFIVGTTAINAFYEDVLGLNSPYPSPLNAYQYAKEKGKEPLEVAGAVIRELIEKVPIIGGARYRGSIAGASLEAVGKLVKPKGKLPETIGTLVGAPGTIQVGKTLRARKRGESTYGQIVGAYTKEKGKLRKPKFLKAKPFKKPFKD